ncbi:MAG: glycosyltransferase family 2 protein [Gammaproteobacteria bacterium]|nr:glycosyltransferase family 2 protein [Gammaproteobacteria bacterium]
MKISIIIPCFNEEKTISNLVGQVLKALIDMKKQIVIVDDCSTDNTFKILQELSALDKSIIIESHSSNQGKGAAIRTALLSVTGDIVIIQDADLEYNPSEFPKLLKPILDGDADVVYGSRFKSGDAARVIYFWHRLGNLILTFLSNMFTNLNLTDMETCYKVFRKEVLNQIVIKENRFGIEPEITAKIAKIRPRLRIYEVGISYYGRTYEEGKKITYKDGFRAIYAIIKYNLFYKSN